MLDKKKSTLKTQSKEAITSEKNSLNINFLTAAATLLTTPLFLEGWIMLTLNHCNFSVLNLIIILISWTLNHQNYNYYHHNHSSVCVSCTSPLQFNNLFHTLAVCPPTLLPMFTDMHDYSDGGMHACVYAACLTCRLTALTSNTFNHDALWADERETSFYSRRGKGGGSRLRLWSHANTTYTGDIGVYVGKQRLSL